MSVPERIFPPWLDRDSLPLVSRVLVLLWSTSLFISGPQLRAQEDIEYNRDIRPILAEYCFACHGFDKTKREAGLRLDTREGATSVLESGVKAIDVGDPKASELLKRVFSSDESDRMPPAELGKELHPRQKEILRKWIEKGAAYQKHWAFIPPQKPELPKLALWESKVKSPIDRFILKRLEKESLAPSAEASPATLLRRLSLDLIGLPPSPQEVDEFVAAHEQDPSKAYSAAVERFLESPHYGERWGRWWLDQARYADSNGYSIDAPRQIWAYRDWVVNALNRDLPFDRFTIEQLAGDLLPEATDEQRIATGFHRNTQINQEGGIDPEQFRIDSVFDRVATTGTVWLGLTIGCAQCHNHKFDPIEQKEYYQLFAFFNNQDEPTLKVYPKGVDGASMVRRQKELDKRMQEIVDRNEEKLIEWEKGLDEASTKKLSRELQKIVSADHKKRNASQKRSLYAEALGSMDEEFRGLLNEYRSIEKTLEVIPTTMVLKEAAQPRKTTVYIQGDFTRPSDEVQPATPSILHALEPASSMPNRLDFARWIVNKNNPLTARVIVNRVWQTYFGRGIVETENDFGLQGAMPSHPELLDWLAVEFMERNWSMKELHRLIVQSRTYQQSSLDRVDLREKDPGNYWLARQKRLRLEAEIVRDVGLTASGLLSRKLGGPPVYPPIPEGVMNQGQVKREWHVSKGEDRYRRGLYTFLYRATPPPSMNVFDAPEGLSSCTRRIRSNTPLQSLTLLNDPAYFEFAVALEKVIQAEGLAAAFKRCTARAPRPDELVLLEKLDSLSAARVLLNLDETVTRE